MSYREELIQVAAVAVAMLSDFDHGEVQGAHSHQAIWADIVIERDHQDHKWGVYRHHDPTLWLTILMEEVGEAAKAHLEAGEEPS